MKKLIHKILKLRQSVSFAFAGTTITEQWILFGKITIVKTYKIL
jgi:hypothetical protein